MATISKKLYDATDKVACSMVAYAAPSLWILILVVQGVDLLRVSDHLGYILRLGLGLIWMCGLGTLLVAFFGFVDTAIRWAIPVSDHVQWAQKYDHQRSVYNIYLGMSLVLTGLVFLQALFGAAEHKLWAIRFLVAFPGTWLLILALALPKHEETPGTEPGRG